MNFPDIQFEQEKYFEAWLVGEQRTEYVLVSIDSNISHSLNIISNCASLGNIIKNSKKKHNIHVKNNSRFVHKRFKPKTFLSQIDKQTTFELNTNTHQQPTAFFSLTLHTLLLKSPNTKTAAPLTWQILARGKVGVPDLQIPASLATFPHTAFFIINHKR